MTATLSNLEQVRQDANFIAAAVEAIDNITTRINGTRWQYELLKLNPELGVITDPRSGQKRTVTADEYLLNHNQLVYERTTYIATITTMLGLASLDEVRDRYMALVAAHQRLTSLRELDIMVVAGHPAAEEESAKANLLTAQERTTAIGAAHTALMTVAQGVAIRPISDLVLATTLPSA